MTSLTGHSINPCFPSSSPDLGATNSQNCIWGSFWRGFGSAIVLLAKEQRESKSNSHSPESLKSSKCLPPRSKSPLHIFQALYRYHINHCREAFQLSLHVEGYCSVLQPNCLFFKKKANQLGTTVGTV